MDGDAGFADSRDTMARWRGGAMIYGSAWPSGGHRGATVRPAPAGGRSELWLDGDAGFADSRDAMARWRYESRGGFAMLNEREGGTYGAKASMTGVRSVRSAATLTPYAG